MSECVCVCVCVRALHTYSTYSYMDQWEKKGLWVQAGSSSTRMCTYVRTSSQQKKLNKGQQLTVVAAASAAADGDDDAMC